MIMKKYFIFAAVAAAGLLTSCSSSDDIAANDAGSIENPDARQAIRLNIGKPSAMITRGTGTIGGVGTTDNRWYGQSINVFMFTKGNHDNDGKLVPGEEYVPTLNLTPGEETGTYLYSNRPMITPGSAENLINNPVIEANNASNSGEAMNKDKSINYYPPQGNFDFFGYRVDDAADSYESEDVPTLVKATGKWTVPFTIDGTQDLMSTKAELTDAQKATLTPAATTQNPTPTMSEDYYSAKAARKNVDPTLTFKHLLTRLQFKVKAGNDATAGWVAGSPAVNYTQAECNTWNEAGANVAGALKYAKTYYSFKSWDPVTTTHQYGEGIAEFVEEKVVSSETYTLVKVIKNDDFGNNGGNWEGVTFAVKAAQTDLATLGENRLQLYTVDVNNSNNIDGTTLPVYVGNMSVLDDAAKDTYNYALSGARKTTDVKTPATSAAVDPTKAVRVTSIEVLSEKTKGSLVVAWLPDAQAGELKDHQKIEWAATQPDIDDRWLTLMERPYAKKTSNDAAVAADFTAGATLTADVTAAQTELSTAQSADPQVQADIDAAQTKLTAATNALNDLLGLEKATISKYVYDQMTDAGKAKYTELGSNNMNNTLIALTPTSPELKLDATDDTDADVANHRHQQTPVGESIILCPGEYTEAPTGTETNYATTTEKLVMRVKIAQNVPVSWQDPTVLKEKTQEYELEIPKPTGGFKQNTSYNIVLTVYGLERIQVMTVVQPWEDGGSIDVGADE